jgi:hypothetical protein
MSRNDSPLLKRGETSSAASFAVKKGMLAEFEDVDYSTSTSGVNLPLSSHRVTCRLVKNSAAIALLPGRLVKYKAGTNCAEVDGYPVGPRDSNVAGFVDEYLPSAGAAVSSYFWIVVRGPVAGLTGLAGDDGNVITEPQWLIALTAATSGATSAGRVTFVSNENSTDLEANEEINLVGYAMSNKTTANTNVSVRLYATLRI